MLPLIVVANQSVCRGGGSCCRSLSLLFALQARTHVGGGGGAARAAESGRAAGIHAAAGQPAVRRAGGGARTGTKGSPPDRMEILMNE